ncbi:hypothetical protein BBI09_00210 [Stutzerimonas xanthomarina]|nr:hypothetical protein BBI09_00210 [Stutzerimonas xanthomarina]
MRWLSAGETIEVAGENITIGLIYVGEDKNRRYGSSEPSLINPRLKVARGIVDISERLGSVIRTIFLLNWIGSRELRQEVTANTNKIESYNGFSKWLSFGGDVIAENDPDEQQKRLRYNDMMASSVILQNTVDMMRILQKLAREGWQFTDEDVSFLSPYQTSNVKRFGEFNLKLNRPPEPWIKDSVFQQAAGSLRVITPRQLDTEKTT